MVEGIERVAILGVGLMGGSLGGALRALDGAPGVVGWTPDGADAEAALAGGLVDEMAANAAEAIDGADLVVLAAPLGAVVGLLEAHSGALSTREVTDLTSLKVPVLEAAGRAGVAGCFVGAHPMCGGTGSGAASADPEIYAGATVHLCEDGATDAARRTVQTFWRALGAEPVWTDAAEHDRRMVGASHLPQLVANALAVEMERAGLSVADLGPGGRDMTRLAASSPDLWLELFAGAGGALPETLRELSGTLEELAGLLDRSDVATLRGVMEQTARWREDR